MYIAPGQGQTAPRGKNFDVNRKALSLYPFVASFKEISLKSDFIQFFFFVISYMYIGRGHTAPRGQSFDLNRNFLSLRSSFSHIKAQWTKFDLAVNLSRSTQGQHLNKLGSTRALDAAYQVSRSSAFWFRRRRSFFKVFIIYGHGGHLGHVTRTV